MFIYLPIIIGVFSLFFLNTNRPKSKRNLFVFTVVLLTIITGLRDPSLFPDMINYNSYFLYKEFYFSHLRVESVNIGYEWLNALFRPTGSFQLFVFSVTLLIIFCYSRTIYRYSPYLLLSLLVFILVDYPFSCFLLRQYLAMATTLLSIPFIINRQLYKFLICMAIAVSFHTTALVFIPVYLLYRTDITYSSKRSLYIFFGLGVLFGGAILPFVLRFLSVYQHYLYVDENEGSIIRLAIKIYLLFVYLYALKDKVWENGINQIVMICMLMAILICTWGLNVLIFFRLRMFFSISEFIGIPIILEYNKRSDSFKKITVGAMLIVYIILLVISYYSFVTNETNPISYELFWK